MAGIYIHIPFCRQRCDYCGFYSQTKAGELSSDYLSALKKDFALRRGMLGSDPVETVYFGGGTPSAIPSDLHADLLRYIYNNVYLPDGLSPGEVTMEVNPGDVERGYCDSLRDIGINRLSMGVQSFDPDMRRVIGRRAEVSGDEMRRIRAAGFDNVSLDLMFGIPGQSIALLDRDIDTMIDWHPEHISTYALTFEEDTVLWKKAERGIISPVSDELYSEMYYHIADRLKEAGYEHYEISNFALPGRRARHNAGYWNDIPYLGIGAAAHSYDGESRSECVADIDRYIAMTEKEDMGYVSTERLSERDKYNDCIATMLRTSDGISQEFIRRKLGGSWARIFLESAERMSGQGMMERCGDAFRLSRKALFISDAVMREMIVI